MIKSVETRPHRLDYILLATIAVLILFGLLMVYNASPVTSLRDFGDPLYLIRLQVIWLVVGLLLGIVVFKVPYTFWQKISPLLIIISSLLLLAVFIPGFGLKVYGAQRWLRFGLINIQPAEFAKLAYIIFLSAYFSKKVKLLPFLLITAFFVGIILAQRDLGTSLVMIFLGFSLYFVAGGGLWKILTLIPVVAAFAGLLILSSTYRKARLAAFLNPSVDPQGISYHINQVLIALGSGGLFGVGLGESRQKYGFIPEVTTDSIFAVIGNELGFFGATLLILAFLLIIYRGFKVAKSTSNKFGQLVAIGVSSWIGFQAFINIAGLTALLPLTGVPLPFISYGGSSLVSVMIASALLLNISCYTATKQLRGRDWERPRF